MIYFSPHADGCAACCIECTCCNNGTLPTTIEVTMDDWEGGTTTCDDTDCGDALNATFTLDYNDACGWENTGNRLPCFDTPVGPGQKLGYFDVGFAFSCLGGVNRMVITVLFYYIPNPTAFFETHIWYYSITPPIDCDDFTDYDFGSVDSSSGITICDPVNASALATAVP